ncbi:MAG: cysteine desulfurase family protein [Bacteroidota bacterium]
MNRIYFDHAATTPLHPEVMEVMNEVMKNHFGNPSSIHALGRDTRTLVEDARKTVARLLNCSPGEIFFTSGGTESDNMAIRKSVDGLGVKHIVTSAIEHHAVLHTVNELEKNGNITKHYINLLPNGHIDFIDLERLLSQNQNVLVSLMYCNNELGNMLDIEKVGAMCKQYNALFHSDTVQAICNYEIDLQKIPVDFIAASAHKFNGPKGTGFIYINSNHKIEPFISGGSQERNMRGGTENIYGICGLAKAMELSCQNLETNRAHIASLKNYMIEKLKASIEGIEFNGDAEGESSYKILNVSFQPNPVSEMMLFKLDIEGISVSGGSACASGSNVGSHVLTAIGIDSNRPSIRFSFGKQNTKEEVDEAVECLCRMLI